MRDASPETGSVLAPDPLRAAWIRARAASLGDPWDWALAVAAAEREACARIADDEAARPEFQGDSAPRLLCKSEALRIGQLIRQRAEAREAPERSEAS